MTSGGPGDFPTGAALGHEYSGEVVELGKGVQRLSAGDRICALPMAGCGTCAACLAGRPIVCASMRMMMGGFGEYTRVVERSAVRLPNGVSLIDGALVEPMACALRGVSKAVVQRGESVLVLGLGAIGLGAIYWARRLGAGRIVASARSTQQSGVALEMGATEFCSASALGGAFHDAPPGIVFECSGAPGMIANAITIVRPGGRMVALGLCQQQDTFIPALATAKEVTLLFSMAYDERDFQFALEAFDRDAVHPSAMVRRTITLDELPLTLEAMRRAPTGGKVLVDPQY